MTWDEARVLVPPVAPDVHKYGRGLVEIHAGGEGSSGAAVIAARGAQAAGAGLVRLFVERSIYPIVASALGAAAPGIMVVPSDNDADENRFKPDAILLGPGWGVSANGGQEHRALFERACAREAAGIPLVLDAGALHAARDAVFHGNAILTPHIGEAAALTGVAKEKILATPASFAAEMSARFNALLVLKSNNMYIASSDGKCTIMEGNLPILASGGSGDLLAGFIAAILAHASKLARASNAARLHREKMVSQRDTVAAAAVAACALLYESARAAAKRFTDPLEIASIAAKIAGVAWL